jgi:mRNA-degrading endonuclease YafQ of YafQ-DinJ toxin-antitoxin module
VPKKQAWVVFAAGVKNKLFEDCRNGVILKDEAIVILQWVSNIENFGADYVQKQPLYQDEEKRGRWAGCRASRFSLRGRIIYKVNKGAIQIVEVQKITAVHNYS